MFSNKGESMSNGLDKSPDLSISTEANTSSMVRSKGRTLSQFLEVDAEDIDEEALVVLPKIAHV